MARLNDFLTKIDLSALHDYVAEHGTCVFYAKGEKLVAEGERCRYIGVVRSGYFKYTTFNSKGNEIVSGFSFEGDVVTDYVRSFLDNSPSLTSIVAGCDSEILCMPIEDVRRHISPGFAAAASPILLQEAYRRYLDMLVKSPAERYRELVGRCPKEMHSLPVQEIASYLGVSRRQLHRIRLSEISGD